MDKRYPVQTRLAARNMDWTQVVMNGGPPCFHLEADAKFCGRAKRWEGHGLKDFHEFMSLERLLESVSDTEGGK